VLIDEKGREIDLVRIMHKARIARRTAEIVEPTDIPSLFADLDQSPVSRFKHSLLGQNVGRKPLENLFDCRCVLTVNLWPTKIA
jgi:hypothetical protein